METQAQRPAERGPARRAWEDTTKSEGEQAPCGAARVAEPVLAHLVYGSFEEVQALREAWNDLASRTGDILCSFDWCEVWWKHFNRWRRLEIHALFEGPRLVAVLPLFRETIRPGGVWLRTVRALGCDYTITTVGLAIEPDYAERFTQTLVAKLDEGGPWDLLHIGPLRCYATVCEPLSQACGQHAGIQTVILGRQEHWDTAFHLPGTHEAFVSSLPSKIRTDLRRRERQLTEGHQVEVTLATTPEQVRSGMDALIELHQKRWTDKGAPGQFAEIKAIEAFHRELADRLLNTGETFVLTLKADGQTIGASHGYHFGGRTHNLFVGHCFNEQWQRFGLGRIMYNHLIRAAIARGSTMLEDGRGLFEHKLQLGGKLYGEWSLAAVRRGWSTRLRFWLALRTAYVIHVLYSRIWVDMVARRLSIRPKGSHFHVRNWMLAQMFRRARPRLFGGPKVVEARCVEAAPPEHLGDPADLRGGGGAGSGR